MPGTSGCTVSSAEAARRTWSISATLAASSASLPTSSSSAAASLSRASSTCAAWRPRSCSGTAFLLSDDDVVIGPATLLLRGVDSATAAMRGQLID